MSKKNPVTHFALVLDRSSSMQSLREEAIAAFNDQCKVIRESEDDGNECYISLITFSTFVDPPHYFDVSAKKIPELTTENYDPSGSTALLDAIADIINRFKNLPDSEDENTSFVVVTITDGEENSSNEFGIRNDGPHRVGAMIKELEATDRWTFPFLCANVDPTKINQTLNIPSGNIRSFFGDKESFTAASNTHSTSLRSYLKGRTEGMGSTPIFYDNTDK